MARDQHINRPLSPPFKWAAAGLLSYFCWTILGVAFWLGTDLNVMGPFGAMGVPFTLWLYWLLRLRTLQRTQRSRQRSLDVLSWGLMLSIVPLPLFLFHQELQLAGLRLAEWVAWAWFGVWAALLAVIGSPLNALVTWLLERDALALDLAEGRAALPRDRVAASARDLGVWRKVQWALSALGVSVLSVAVIVFDNMQGAVSLVVCALCLLVAGGLLVCQRQRAKRPQRGALFGPLRTLLDEMIPSLVMGCVGFSGLMALGEDNDLLFFGFSIALVVVILAIIFQVPSLVISKDRERWLAAWDADNAAALKALTEGEDLSLVAKGLDLTLTIDSLALGARGLTLRAVEVRAPHLYTGDLAFDTRFDLPQVSGRTLGALGASVRAAALALHDFGLSVEGDSVRCHVRSPWQVGAAADALLRLARAWAPPQGDDWRAFTAQRFQVVSASQHNALLTEWRLLTGALSEPVPLTRCLCAQALVDAWQRDGMLADRLRERVAGDPPSAALMHALSAQDQGSDGRAVCAALTSDSPWPTSGGVFAQALSVSALDWLDEATARAALSPPRGRLLKLPIHFSLKAAAKAAAVGATSDDWIIDALNRAQYAEHKVSLCQALAAVGTVQSLSTLQALARDESLVVMIRDAARAATTAITLRLNLSDAAGALALSDLAESGALSITST